MPQSLSQVIIHLIFSTKNRAPCWTRRFGPRVHAIWPPYAEIWEVRHFGSGDGRIHVHIVTSLSRTVTQAELVEDVKKASSKWIKELGPNYADFYWQRGYGVFSVSRSQMESVYQVCGRTRGASSETEFSEEYRAFLHKHGIKFDEQYVWD